MKRTGVDTKLTSITFEDCLGFIRELYPDKERIGLHEPVFLGKEKDYLADCIDSTFVSYVGEYVNRFEQSVQDYTGSPFAKAIINGTSALHLALTIAGTQREDIVITQSMTFVATANAISYCGAIPYFLDVSEETLGMDVQALEHFLSHQTIRKDDDLYHKESGRRIAACLPVHVMGHACDIERIAEICTDYGIVLVEDAAEGMGSSRNGQHLGTFGDIGVLSFNGNKTITTGCGGMILCKDEHLAERAKHISTTAKKNHPWAFEHDEVGYNYRLSNVSAAIGLAQMETLDRILRNKRDTAKRYEEFFQDTGYRFIKEPENSSSNYWLNTVQLPDEETRTAFLDFMNAEGVNCRPIWTPMHMLPMYREALKGPLDMTERLSSTLVNLPSSYR